MNIKRTYLFIAISSMALMLLLIIQVHWIFQSSRIKEAMFNEKANMVLSKTTESLLADSETCRRIGDSVERNYTSGLTARIGQHEIRTIDSLFNHYMRFYNFHIDYTFEVIKPNPELSGSKNSFSDFAFNKPLFDLNGGNEIHLKLIIPDKRQFILAEMGLLFITSLLLIIVVLILFWRTVLSLLKEQKIATQTTDFLNNMTHEFKTPMTNIALAGKMMMKEPEISQGSKLKHYAGIICAENEKLGLQVDQVLNMSALEREEIRLIKRDLDFHELIQETLNHFSLQIEHKAGQCQVNLKAQHFVVNGDKTHFTNALYNLVDNAIKYSDGKPELLVQTRNHSQHLIIDITDHGIGIDPAFRTKVFDRYFRIPTGNVHDVKGFGLGLTYTKKIVELHGGTVEIQSEKGMGTTFKITLPHV